MYGSPNNKYGNVYKSNSLLIIKIKSLELDINEVCCQSYDAEAFNPVSIQSLYALCIAQIKIIISRACTIRSGIIIAGVIVNEIREFIKRFHFLQEEI